MNSASTATTDSPPPALDLEALKTRQRGAWSSGDYAVVGTTLQIVGEELCEALDLRSSDSVLDVAAGNGNASLAAARRWCAVTSTDYVPALLERGRGRAAADGLTNVEFREADAEALPFEDGNFDVVVSTFGVMFTPNHTQAAAELYRVCKPGGKIGLANWTPEGFIGQLFKVIGKHVPPPAGAKSPGLWGTRPYLADLFPAAASLEATTRDFVFRYRSPEHWLDVFATYYGPLLKALGALEPPARAAFESDIQGLIARFNRATDGSMVVPSEYLEVVVRRST
jgi:ubiquinone/menaquinone biosynthesis C-methylase UbiE